MGLLWRASFRRFCDFKELVSWHLARPEWGRPFLLFLFNCSWLCLFTSSFLCLQIEWCQIEPLLLISRIYARPALTVAVSDTHLATIEYISIETSRGESCFLHSLELFLVLSERLTAQVRVGSGKLKGIEARFLALFYRRQTCLSLKNLLLERFGLERLLKVRTGVFIWERALTANLKFLPGSDLEVGWDWMCQLPWLVVEGFLTLCSQLEISLDLQAKRLIILLIRRLNFCRIGFLIFVIFYHFICREVLLQAHSLASLKLKRLLYSILSSPWSILLNITNNLFEDLSDWSTALFDHIKPRNIIDELVSFSFSFRIYTMILVDLQDNVAFL